MVEQDGKETGASSPKAVLGLSLGHLGRLGDPFFEDSKESGVAAFGSSARNPVPTVAQNVRNVLRPVATKR
jgi:hypothetical protein